MKQVILILAILFLQDYLVVQCLVVSVTSIASMAFLGYNKPSSNNSLNKSGIFDEFLTLLVMDSLLVSSDPSLHVDMRQEIGLILIGLLGLAILVGQIPILFTNCINLKTKCKARFAKKGRQQKIERKKVSVFDKETQTVFEGNNEELD